MKNAEVLRNEFWQEDAKNGGFIFSQYKEIKEALALDNIYFAEQKYDEIKKFAIEHTDFYKNYNLTDEFPVLNKEMILKHYEEHKSRSGFTFPTHISSTSGSTGTPFAVIQDYIKRKRTIADLKVFGEMCNYPSHERMLFFRVLNSKLHRTPEIEDMENIYYIDSSDLGEQHLGEMVKAIIDKNPRIIFSYASTLVELAKYIITKQIPSDKFMMKSVLTAGEGISEYNRKMVEKAFGCVVYRRYSDMELGILGQDMGNGSQYILNWGSYYFECLKTDTDEPANFGEVGRIVITDLFNKSFPLIRYDTGDLGIMSIDEGSLPVLKEIYGRSRDCVYTTDGRLLSPAKIFVSMWDIDNIKQWQFIQEEKNYYVIKLNTTGVIDEEKIKMNFINILGKNANIYFEYVEEVPILASNKRRAVICNYKK